MDDMAVPAVPAAAQTPTQGAAHRSTSGPLWRWCRSCLALCALGHVRTPAKAPRVGNGPFCQAERHASAWCDTEAVAFRASALDREGEPPMPGRAGAEEGCER